MNLNEVFRDVKLRIKLRNLVSCLTNEEIPLAIDALEKFISQVRYDRQCKIYKNSFPKYAKCSQCGHQVQERKACYNCRMNSA